MNYNQILALTVSLLVFSSDVFCHEKTVKIVMPVEKDAKVVKVSAKKTLTAGAAVASVVLTGAKAAVKAKKAIENLPIVQKDYAIAAPVAVQQEKVVSFPSKKAVKIGSMVAGAVVGTAIGGAKAALKHKPVVQVQTQKKVNFHVPIKPEVQESLIIQPVTKFNVMSVKHQPVYHEVVAAKKASGKGKIFKPFLKAALLSGGLAKAKAKIFGWGKKVSSSSI